MKGEEEKGEGRFLVQPATVAVLAVFCLLALLVAGFGSRLGLWHFRTGFTVLRVVAYCGLVAAGAAAVTLFIAAKRKKKVSMVLSVLALAAAVVAVALPVSWGVKASRVPKIHDISTDVNSPPQFVAVAPQRPDRVQYGGAAVASEQLKAYPDLKTVILNMPADQAFAKALVTAKEMGWEVVAMVPAEGRIEATDTTFWFGFKDDISIRVVPAGERSLLDLRSASRVGISDVGTNAERIRSYLKKFQGGGA
ncbi:DUF1499 domain-containing protein [Geomonas sp. RF6]|uniref:DUF1499 domain-containing protein n=1 Tax=Geomonas sp. RF6 TaxID=2897342 RepID=UPI001E299BF6|nr:DUF1499 domain-containing protein [Geomonas sp. RF6]UFS70294.1 DUF1499 domain-containing protein [Geomonas sp. RF6]